MEKIKIVNKVWIGIQNNAGRVKIYIWIADWGGEDSKTEIQIKTWNK